ncbi:MAG: hypothetical protein EB043_05235, partial [Actinobacteria bacterium]|nr:hypothetical protein [Actinomycetota bacterium]
MNYPHLKRHRLIRTYEHNRSLFDDDSPMTPDHQESFQEYFQFFSPAIEETKPATRKLYLIPTTHGENFDPDFAPNPSPLSELPNIERWTLTYTICAIEILAGRRPIAQLARSTHRYTYNEISSKIGSIREVPKIRKIHRHQPIDGVIEVTVTLAFTKRVRALVARFEGV